jgi:hypothetical protein
MNDNYMILIALLACFVTGLVAGDKGAKLRSAREAHLWWKNKKGR